MDKASYIQIVEECPTTVDGQEEPLEKLWNG